MNKKFLKTFIFMALLAQSAQVKVNSQEMNPLELSLEDPEDAKLLLEEFPETEAADEISDANVETGDDLDSLKDDLGEIEFTLPEEDDFSKKIKAVDSNKTGTKPVIFDGKAGGGDGSLIFDVGKEEKDLLAESEKMQGKIPEKEWNEISNVSATSTYTVSQDEWLWKISKSLFGSGFYYSKIWSLNPYITNPHEIEPGMILSFSTGSDSEHPEVQVGSFDRKSQVTPKAIKAGDIGKWGDETTPKWITDRENLKTQGVYVQYASAETDKDLTEVSEQSLIKEYEAYEPPRPDFDVGIPKDQYDQFGFDRNAKIDFKFNEGFYLNTFVSTNIVQDFGKIEAGIDAKAIFTSHDKVYLRFDNKLDVIAGDKFSIYTPQGEISHENSDREGYKYTIGGSVQTIQKHNDLWECEVLDTVKTVSRGDRVTVYTPRIERITKTFNARLIESVIMNSYKPMSTFASFGDVVYLDRGRADGVEMGNVFEVYGFKDRGTERNITENPTYKSGELTIITLTDNFATALVTSSARDFEIGDIAITKTKDAAARAAKLKLRKERGDHTRIEDDSLDELDVELNVDDLNDNLLNKADKIQFTEDELAELERQEREKSILTENEKDLRSLERLEKEISTAEAMMNEARLDEDKWLEGQNLNEMENSLLYQEQESLDEIEENFGKRYLDEDLNDKDNPYGLTEFDIEEIDELLNVEKEMQQE